MRANDEPSRSKGGKEGGKCVQGELSAVFKRASEVVEGEGD
jgi:hypothetical protein